MGAYAKTRHGGKVVDEITKQALLAVEKRLGYKLTVVQGSYNRGEVGASAGTHDGGGAVDLSPADWKRKVRALREVGFAAWHRPELWRNGKRVWGEHIHAVLIGNQQLSPAALAQVHDYRARRNGLANNGPDDFDFHPDGVVFKYTPPPPKPKKVPVQWGRFLHADPYRLGNSFRGLDLAVKRKLPAVDIDVHETRDGVIVATHWPQPMLKEGFIDPLGKLNPKTRVEDMTWAEVSRLRTKDGFVIHRASTMLRQAAKRKLRVEMEAKGPIHRKSWERLKVVADNHKVSVQVKTLTSIKGYPARLKAAHGIFPTIVLPRGTRRVPRSLWSVIDYVRGPVIWTGA